MNYNPQKKINVNKNFKKKFGNSNYLIQPTYFSHENNSGPHIQVLKKEKQNTKSEPLIHYAHFTDRKTKTLRN